MFEKLLEKVLLARLGKFIAGLDKDNLKVALWTGDITLENVYLKPDTLLRFQLPLFLSVGKIKKLTIKVPWTRLGSAPVEIFLEGLYVVVVPQERTSWSYSEEGDILRRKEYIESHENRRKQAQERKEAEEDEKQKSFVERLGSKVIDNLKISISDIHIRFEQVVESQPFAAGITLETIEVYTTNALWERHFTDRTEQDIFKILTVSSLALYWTSEDCQLVSAEADENTQIDFLTDLIHNAPVESYVICPINACAKITHRSAPSDFERPLYTVSIELPDVTLRYRQKQFHDTVKMVEYFTEFNKFLLKAENIKKFKVFSPAEKNPRSLWRFAISSVIRTIRQRRDRTFDYFQTPLKINKAFEQDFKMIHRKKIKGLELAPDEEAKYDQAVYLSNISDVLEWTSHVLSVVDNEKKERPSWFNFWKKNEEDEEYERIFRDIEQSEAEQFPKDYVWVDFSFQLSQGALELVKNVDQVTESLRFELSLFSVSVRKKTQGTDFTASVDDFSLIYNQNDVLCTKIPTAHGMPLCMLELKLQPNDRECEASLAINTQPLEIIFSKHALSSVVSFFVVPSAKESAKNAAWDTLQGLQDSTQETLMDLLYGEAKYLVSLNISGPQIKLPSPNLRGYFVLKLGHLTIENPTEICEGQYELYKFTVRELGLDYQDTPVIPSFCINTELQFMKSKHRKRKWELLDSSLTETPDVIVKGELPSLQFVLSPSIYHQLLRLDESFQLEEETWLTLERSIIVKDSKLVSNMKRLGTNVQNWYDYNVALQGSYLYFFSSESDSFASSYYYIKDCSVADCSSEFGVSNSLKLSNRYGECILAFESSSDSELWLSALNEQVGEIQNFSSAAAEKKLPRQLAQAHWMHIMFKIPNISLILGTEEGIKLTDITLKDISTQLKFRPFDFSADVELQFLHIIDLNRQSSPHFSSLAISHEDTSLIDLKINYLGKKSPLYTGKDILMKAKLGSLEFNWNPDQLVTILNFFEFASFSDPSHTKSAGGKLQPNHVLLDLEIELIKLDLFLNVVEYELLLAKVTFHSVNTNLLVLNGGYHWTCACKNIELFDLTNYPKTSLKLPIEPFRLFSVREESGTLLEFTIFIYSDDNPEKPHELGATVDLHLSSATIIYLHQPVFRVIDFFNERMLGLLDVSTRIQDSHTWSKEYRISNLFDDSTLKALTAETPNFERSFTKIDVKIDNPLLVFLPRPGFSEHFTADLGKIIISNSPSSSEKRHPQESVWVDIFDVYMHNINITNRDRTVTEEFNVKLQVEKPVMSPQLPKDADLRYILRGDIEEMKFNISQEDFTLMFQLADLNMAYDDRMDEIFNPTAPSISDPNHGGVFLSLDLNINLVSLLLLYKSEEITELLFRRSLLTLNKYNDCALDLRFLAYSLVGLITEKENEMFRIPDESFLSSSRLSHVLFGPISSGEDTPIFTADLKSSVEGNKDIIIEFLQFRINFHLAVFQKIQNFFYYAFPEYKDQEHTPFDYLKGELNSSYIAPSLAVNVSFKQPIALLPTVVTNRVLVCQSDVSFKYFREREDRFKDAPAYLKRLITHELEIYTCKLEDLDLLSVLQSGQKRRILEPIQLIYESSETKVNLHESLFSIIYQSGKLNFVVSHRDLVLISAVIDYQRKKLDQNQRIINRLSGIIDLDSQEEDSAIKPIENLERVLRTTSSYFIAGITVVLINDAAGAYSPVVDLNIGDLSAMGVHSENNWNFKTSVSIKSNYYNPQVNQWEPFLELFSCEIEAIDCPLNNPNNEVFIKADSNLPLNINVTEPMVKYMLKIRDSWSKASTEEVKEVVSPLSIINNTGYQVMVEKTMKHLYSSVPDTLLVNPGEMVDYEIDTTVMRVPELYQEVVTLYLFASDQPSDPIANIPINKVQSLTYEVMVNSEKIPVVVEIEMFETRKLLRISSPIVVLNKTPVSLCMFMARGSFSETVVCPPSETTPIPILYFRGTIGFALQNSTEELFMFNIMTDLICNRRTQLETRIGNFYLVITYKNPQKFNSKFTLVLRSPVTYINRLPVDFRLLLFYEGGYRSEEVQLKAGGQEQDHSCSVNSQIIASIFLPEFSGSNRFTLVSPKSKPPKKVVVYDIKKSPLNVHICYRNKGAHQLIFYCPLAIINNSEMPLTFFYKNSGTLKLVPGQNYRNHIIPCNSAKRLAVGLGSRKAESFKIKTVGVQNVVSFSGERTPQNCQNLYQFIYDINLSQVIKQELIFTKVVSISPRFIILNKLGRDLYMKEYQSPASALLVPNGERLPFHWPDYVDKDPLVSIKEEGKDEWDWSGAFSISNIGTFPIQCKNLVRTNSYKLIKVDIKVVGESVFVVFEEENLNFSSYRIVNSSNIVTLEASQSGFDDIRRVNTLKSIAFAWSRPHAEHVLVISFYLDNLDLCCPQKFNLDKINRNYKAEIRTTELHHTVYIYVTNEGPTKIIEFTDIPIKKKSVMFDTIYKQYSVQIPQVGLSFIEYTNGRACELLYLSLINLKIDAQKTLRLWQAEVSIDSIQIDNQISSSPIYPVLLFPDPHNQKSAIQFSISTYINSHPQCYNFECCELLVQTLCLRLESMIVRKILGFVGRLFLEEQPVYYTIEVFDRFQRATWRHDELLNSNKRFYFGTLKLCPIKIICSFIPIKNNEEAETVDSFQTVAKALGMAIIAVDMAPIKLYTVEMHQLHGSQSQVLSALWMHYKAQLTAEMFTLIGHAAVLGNPVGLFNNLGTGVFDFFYEPAQGIIKGPVSAGKGFLKGTQSLVSNTVQGTFGTVSKLTNTLATGITVIAGKDYNMERQMDQAINKPKNVVHGIGLGFKSLFTNIGKGFTGVVTEPFKGYKRNKMKGFFAGGARGFSGLIVKPVAGVLDVASNTAEGIKNTARKDMMDIPRIRMPRPFYGPYEILKGYNDQDAQVTFFVSKLKKGMYANEKFIGQCVSNDYKDRVWAIAIYMKYIIAADVKSNKILWVVDTNKIKTTEHSDQGICIYTAPSEYKNTKNKTAFVIPFRDKAATAHLNKKISYVLNNIK